MDTYIDDVEFDELLTAALYRAAELDYGDIPPDDELDKIVQPSPRFQRRMKAMLRDPNGYVRRLRRPMYLKVLQSAAAVFVALTVLLGAAMAASPTVRAAVIDFVRSWFEDRTEYWTPGHELDRDWTFAYIPEGFEQTEEIRSDLQLIYIYMDSHGTPISIAISKGKQIVDNEHSDFYMTTIDGRSVDVYESNDPQYPNMLVIYDDVSGTIISLISEIELGELMKIAENIE